MAIIYKRPVAWVVYDVPPIIVDLVEAKSAVMSLTNMPYQRGWAEELQKVQLKWEVAGTSRIEGAEFTESELDAVLKDTPTEDLITRSQRQVKAAVETYRWIAKLQDDRPIDRKLISEVHRRIISGADDDHCPAGVIRNKGQNVTFGNPLHRGADGGEECDRALDELCNAIQKEFRGHDLLIQALALHYHFAAIHPFLDGNGRTARALEALVLQRAGLRDTLFIAMSNYYYEEKVKYLETLGEVRAQDHDLTPFLIFGLKGIAIQCKRLFGEIRKNVAKEMFENLMYNLFMRLKTPKKRVIAKRQIEVLNVLLKQNEMDWQDLIALTKGFYHKLDNPVKALVRDINYLGALKAIRIKRKDQSIMISINLDWPAQITETNFFEITKEFPKAKPHSLIF